MKIWVISAFLLFSACNYKSELKKEPDKAKKFHLWEHQINSRRIMNIDSQGFSFYIKIFDRDSLIFKDSAERPFVENDSGIGLLIKDSIIYSRFFVYKNMFFYSTATGRPQRIYVLRNIGGKVEKESMVGIHLVLFDCTSSDLYGWANPPQSTKSSLYEVKRDSFELSSVNLWTKVGRIIYQDSSQKINPCIYSNKVKYDCFCKFLNSNKNRE